MVDPKTYLTSLQYLVEIATVSKGDTVKPHLVGLEMLRPRPYRWETDDDREWKAAASDGDITKYIGCLYDACGKARSEANWPNYTKFSAYAHLIPPQEAPPNEDEFFFLCSYKIVAFVLGEGKWSMFSPLIFLLHYPLWSQKLILRTKLLSVEHVQEVMSRSNAFVIWCWNQNLKKSWRACPDHTIGGSNLSRNRSLQILSREKGRAASSYYMGHRQ